MNLKAQQGDAAEVMPVLAKMLGSSVDELRPLAEQLTMYWIVYGANHLPLGAVGLRRSPSHGMEMIGGAVPGEAQHSAALAIVLAVLEKEPRIFTYGEENYLPPAALEKAGLRAVSSYTQMSGALPQLSPEIPRDFTFVRISELERREDLLAAHQTYSDRIGHTLVPPEVYEPDFGGTRDALGWVAYDVEMMPAGICRVALAGEEATIGTPGVHPRFRRSGLLRALLLSACRSSKEVGATRLMVQAWGDTDEERAEDEALGLAVQQETPIYSSMPI